MSVVCALRSPDIATRIEATYALQVEDIIQRPQVVEALRENLISSDSDLVEITVMRLGLRGRDYSSAPIIAKILCNNHDTLVQSACILTLSGMTSADLIPKNVVRDAFLCLKAIGGLDHDIESLLVAESEKVGISL